MDTKVGIEPTPMGLQPISPPRGTRCILFKTQSFCFCIFPKYMRYKKKFLLYVSFKKYNKTWLFTFTRYNLTL